MIWSFIAISARAVIRFERDVVPLLTEVPMVTDVALPFPNMISHS